TLPRTFSCRARSTSPSPRRSRGSAVTRHPAAATSRRRLRPARASKSRCSSTSGMSFGWTPARASTSHVRRSEQRRAAVWALYQSDLLGRPLEDTFPRDVHAFTRALAELVRSRQPELDEL